MAKPMPSRTSMEGSGTALAAEPMVSVSAVMLLAVNVVPIPETKTVPCPLMSPKVGVPERISRVAPVEMLIAEASAKSPPSSVRVPSVIVVLPA